MILQHNDEDTWTKNATKNKTLTLVATRCFLFTNIDVMFLLIFKFASH